VGNLVETKFDATYGNVLEIKRYDFGAAMPPTGNPMSDTHNTPCYSHTKNSSGTDVAKTQIIYGCGCPRDTPRKLYRSKTVHS
jgi:hypothetical protein